jgi:hypothetical protein
MPLTERQVAVVTMLLESMQLKDCPEECPEPGYYWAYNLGWTPELQIVEVINDEHVKCIGGYIPWGEFRRNHASFIGIRALLRPYVRLVPRRINP